MTERTTHDVLVDIARDRFRFLCPVETLFGRGISEDLPSQLERRRFRRPLVLTDPSVAAAAASLLDLIGGAFPKAAVWMGEGGEPTDRSARAAVAAARDHRPDVVVALGGGSVLDSAKVVAVAAAADDGADVREFLRPGRRTIGRCLPWVALPTTAGTGAEVTRGTVVVDEEKGCKRGFGGGGCYATLALLDPGLTDGLPAPVTATSGIDAFCHAVEAFLSPNAFPVGDALSTVALALIRKHFSGALAGTAADRDGMMMAAWLSALSFSTGAGLTLAHDFSDLVGPRTALPHGFAAAVWLPAVAERAECHDPERAEVARLLVGPERPSLSDAVGAVLGSAGVPHVADVLEPAPALRLLEEAIAAGAVTGPPEAARTLVHRSYELAR
ncbi:MAG: iron-containing alcohol dehydrogenase [Actinomycetota bacterium]|nr:iron-containing alcohol dehydrogenase [Actinomycetota bacterium]